MRLNFRSTPRAEASPEAAKARRTMRGKLQMLVLISVSVSVGLVAGVSAWRDSERDAALQADRLHATALAIGSVASEATAAGDRAKAFGALRSISQMPGVLYARIEDPAGRLLVETGSGARLLRDVEVGAAGDHAGILSNLTSRSFEVTAPVSYMKTEVGRIVLLARSEGVLGLFLSSLLASAVAAIAAMGAGLLAAARLQRSVTRPIVALTRSMQEVARDHDYSGTVEIKADDEVGELVEGFNRMLQEVRARDVRIADHLAGLEQEVADRTADARAARDAAEQANNAKSDFLATMSHEIRTPMNGIMVMAEMLAAGDMAPRQRRFAHVIAKSGSSLLSIINDILDFSKIEAGKMELESTPMDLCDVVEDVCALFWEKASSKGLDLSAYVDPATPRLVMGDPTRLRQIVGNLVNNAIKFTEAGGVLIEVEPDSATSVRISVRDTGIGIPKDKIAGVFGAFTQADQSTTRKFGGTGLGLAICKRLVDGMGGRFHVTSDVGRGSTFAFRLPMTAAEPAQAWPTAGGDALRALVAHSGVSTRRALSRYLARAGYAVEPAKDGEQAAPALVIGAPTALRELGATRLPTICLGEYGDSAALELQREGLAQAVLIQPLRRRELEGLLAQAARGEPLRESVEAAESGASPDRLPTFPTARVLVADDSAVNREVAIEALARLGVQARSVNDGRAAVQALAAERFDLVLMDGSMPVMDGYEASLEIRRREAEAGAQATPVVALTAHVVGAAAEAWRDAGMDAVLHKPFTLAAMAAVLGRFLVAGEPVADDAVAAAEPAPSSTPIPQVDAELLDAQVAAQLAEMAGAGRGEFVERVRALYRDNAPGALAAVQEGVKTGDAEAVARGAHALKSMSYNVGAKAVAALAGTMEARGRDGALPSGAELDALSATLDRTFAALGGSPAPQRSAPPSDDGERALLADLEEALASDQLNLLYQPQFDRDGDRVLGVEALIRWTHPVRGPVSPADFIPLAERHGLISRVTDWVVGRVISDSSQLEHVPIAFNVSAAEFKKVDFVERMLSRFDKPGIDKHRFEIEITETLVLDDEAQVVENIHRLHEHGFKIALDDFGAGHTSLRNLRRIPFDKLKIDQEFVSDCIADVQSASLVHAVVSIGRALGMKVVAEGVETELQRKFLKVAGVQLMQGFLLSKPIPIAAVERMRRGVLEPAPLRESA